MIQLKPIKSNIFNNFNYKKIKPILGIKVAYGCSRAFVYQNTKILSINPKENKSTHQKNVNIEHPSTFINQIQYLLLVVICEPKLRARGTATMGQKSTRLSHRIILIFNTQQMGAVKNLLFAPTVIPKLSVSFAIGNSRPSLPVSPAHGSIQ